jgi:CDP-glycerol glycerophosphotransferase (TagB/SpsB family)
MQKDFFTMKKIKYFLIYPCGIFIFLISLITPRLKKKWCFGGTENSKYMFLLTDFKQLGIKAYWFSNDKKEIYRLKKLGYNAYTKFSLMGLFHLLTSKIYFITHGFGDVNRFTIGNVKIVNLHHGLPYKKISNEDTKHQSTFFDKLMYPTSQRKIDLFLSTSPFMTEIFKRSISVKNNNYVESGNPRNMLLLMDEEKILGFLKKIEARETISEIQFMKKFKKVYIYMPTFRDSQNDFIEEASFDFDKLNESMKLKNALFIFKLHPATKTNILKRVENYSNMKILNKEIDVYPLLPFTDCLITDYSSIYFDYILMGKKKRVIFFPFDRDEYKLRDREFNFNESFMKGEYAYRFENLLHLIEMQDESIPFINQDDNIELFWGNHKDVSGLINAIMKL